MIQKPQNYRQTLLKHPIVSGVLRDRLYLIRVIFLLIFFCTCKYWTINPLAGADDRLVEGQNEEPLWTWRDIKWRNTIVLTLLHIATVYSFFDLPRYGLTYFLQFMILLGAAFGVTAGSHRYFTHRTYRANNALRYFLIFLQTLSAQEDIIKVYLLKALS